MSLKKLASEISGLEGRKVQASIGNIREILGIISDHFWNLERFDLRVDLAHLFTEAGRKRALRKKKKV